MNAPPAVCVGWDSVSITDPARCLGPGVDVNEFDRRPPPPPPACLAPSPDPPPDPIRPVAASQTRSEDRDGFIGPRSCGLGDCGLFPPLPRSEPNSPLAPRPPTAAPASTTVWLTGSEPGAWRSAPSAARASARLFSRLWMRSSISSNLERCMKSPSKLVGCGASAVARMALPGRGTSSSDPNPPFATASSIAAQSGSVSQSSRSKSDAVMPLTSECLPRPTPNPAAARGDGLTPAPCAKAPAPGDIRAFFLPPLALDSGPSRSRLLRSSSRADGFSLPRELGCSSSGAPTGILKRGSPCILRSCVYP
mmetsp:Transcript_10164/g.44203  ORF Transcript_10164/g.44203 Transcript_10164/m.44203 type:complete len:308 (+) Transcript_10164:1789-2712(+)